MITRLPLAPPFLTGVAMLRRQPVLVFSLARLLGGEPAAAPGGHVVVAVGKSRFILAVDAIGGLQRLSATDAAQSAGGPIRSGSIRRRSFTPKWLALTAEMSGTAARTGAGTDRQRFLCVSLGERTVRSPWRRSSASCRRARRSACRPARRRHRRRDRIRRPDHAGHRRLAVAVAPRRRRGRGASSSCSRMASAAFSR